MSLCSALEPLAQQSAVLRPRGFSVVSRTADGYETFDYQTLVETAPWEQHRGLYTAFGDVNELLVDADDRYIVLATGDEAGIRFEATLPPLGFELVGNDEASWTVRVPRRRHDLTLEVDLIEEICRHRGFDRITPTLPAFSEGAQPRSPWEVALQRMRASLVASGYHQAISYTFGAPEDMARWGS